LIPTTPISDVNRNAGIKPIKVPQEVFDLVQRSIISELTSGALTSVMPQWIKFEI
jgi:thiamine biosynthesis lipoprotein